MKKIIFMTNGFFDKDQPQFQFLNYARYLSKDYFSLMMLFIFPTSEKTSTVQELKREGVKVKSLNSKARVTPVTILRCLKVFKEFMPDIIHTQHPIAGVNGRVAGLLFRLFYNRKVIIISEQRNAKHGFSLKARFLERATFPIANLILCVSRGVEESFFGSSLLLSAEHFMNGKRKHFTFLNSIDVNKGMAQVSNIDRETMREKLNIKKEEIVLISIGRLTLQKGYNYLIEALSEMKDKGINNVKLFLVGEGELKETLQEQAIKMNVDEKILFLGYRNDISELLYMSDIFILPSLWEGLPKSLLEAMSMGLPCVASNVVGNNDVIRDGFDGILVPPQNSEELSNAIELLIKDNQLRSTISINAIKRVSLFSVEAKTKELESIYKKLLK